MNHHQHITKQRFEPRRSGERISKPNFQALGGTRKKPFTQKLRLVLLALMALLGVRSVSEATAACNYSIAPTGRMHGYGAATNSVIVTASSNVCAWTVVNTNTWITIMSATSGTGDGTVNYTVAANPSPLARTGVVVIAQQIFTVQQQGVACTYSVSPTSRTHGYGAASNSVSVTTSSGCPWTVVNTNTWITITSPTSGAGDGTVSYEVAANPSMNDRTGAVLIGGESFTVTQRGIPCTYSISPNDRTHGYGAASNFVSVTTPSECWWVVVNTNAWITITSATSGSGSGNVTYMVDANPNPMERTGVVMIADQLLTLKQRAVVCAYDITPTTRTHGFGETTGTVIVSTSGGCSWTVVNTNTWITILSSTQDMGFGSVGYKVAFNHSINERSGVIMIADQALFLTQRGLTNTGFFFQSITLLNGGQVKLKVLGPPNSTCELQASLDLINWQRIFSATNTTGSVEYIDTLPSSVNRRMYRALLR